MLLDTDIEDISIHADGSKETWNFHAVQRWLRDNYNKQLIRFTLSKDNIYYVAKSIKCILIGPSPRNPDTVIHAVVAEYRDNHFEIIFDPHSDDTGILLQDITKCEAAFLLDIVP